MSLSRPSLFGQLCTCKKCGKELRERKRKPCPRCGSMSRIHGRRASDSLGAEDKLN